jgi:uncharacterized protein YbjT (DUF2867 family)
MRVLMLGANGFLGGHLLATLASRGHEVVAAVRDPASVAGRGGAGTIAIDLNRDTEAQAWIPRLEGIDAVVNCAGVLQGTRRDDIEAIHALAPAALFEACGRCGVRRVVQISAVSADREAGTPYALTKLAADDKLRASALEWTVLRPSLVYAPGVFGGTALLRALAAFPFFVPLPGAGEQRFQPIAIEDIGRIVVRALETDALVGKTLDPVGPDVITLREILGDLRGWLGFGRVPFVQVPMSLIGIAAKAGDLFGGPLNTTALRQLSFGNVSDFAAYRDQGGVHPATWREQLRAHPAQWQDRWHARLYFVRPPLRYGIAALWLLSAISGWSAIAPWARLISESTGMPLAAANSALAAACLMDLAIGAMVAVRWRPGAMAAFQVAVIAAYTVALSVLRPDLWLDPFAAIAKNLVIVPAILALAALEQDR